MHKLDQKGSFNLLIIPLVAAVLVMIGLGIVAFMFYGDFVEQRDQNKPLIEAAVEDAKTTQRAELEAEFIEREKEPYDTYTSPSETGSVKLVYPKTWSSYVVVGSGNASYDFYAHPAFVPSEGVRYALRSTVERKDFAAEVKKYDSQIQKGELRATAVAVAGTQGVRLDGFIDKDQEGSLVMFPVRDKILKVWTESPDFIGDFNNIVLKNLTFVP